MLKLVRQLSYVPRGANKQGRREILVFGGEKIWKAKVKE